MTATARPRSRAPRRLVAFLGTLALVAGVGGFGAGRLLGSAVPAQAQEPAFVVTAHGEAAFSGAADPPIFILVVGNDERPGVSGRRADSLHVVGINQAQHTMSMIDIPRDTWVDYPDGSGSHRINEGNPRGGPELQAQLVSQLVGVPIAFTVEVNFGGFVGLINELGGVDINVPFAMNEANSGAHFDAGLQHMDGDAALAFSRNRHIPGGDFTRSRDQAQVLLATLAAARAQVQGPSSALHALSTFLSYGEIDGGSWDDLFRLGQLALSIDPSTVRDNVMPGHAGNAGGASVVFVDPPAAYLFADFADDAILQLYPADPPL